MKIAIAQLNPRIGDLENNYQAAKVAVAKAHQVNAELVVFPELAVMGYPPKDLLEKPDFLDAVSEYNMKWEKLASEKTGVLFGSVMDASAKPGKPLSNVAILSNGNGHLHASKCLLPTYDVFDEQRYFKPNTRPQMMLYKGMKLAVLLCEDSWARSCHLYEVNPMEKMIGSDVIINLSASPYCIGKHEARVGLLSEIARNHKAPLIYVNQVGANDDVIYDGHSLVFNAKGQCCVEMASCKEDFKVIDTENILWSVNRPSDGAAEIHDALVMGVRDYVRKTGFSKVVIGLSGGIDSAVTACIAAEALGSENVVGIGMPSKFSSAGSRNDAKALAFALGIEFNLISISGVYDAYGKALGKLLESTSSKTELWEENIQARIRGAMLMAYSNRFGHLLLTTGNKSEIAMGFFTSYGDACGGLAVISDLLKGRVYDQARYINKHGTLSAPGKPPIPKDTIEKAPSAELRPNQVDQDSLPPYPVLDFVLQMYVEEGAEPHHIATEMVRQKVKDVSMFAASKLVNDIIRRVDAAEFKRKQLPPGLRITKKAFGTGRVMPIAQGWKGMP